MHDIDPRWAAIKNHCLLSTANDLKKLIEQISPAISPELVYYALSDLKIMTVQYDAVCRIADNCNVIIANLREKLEKENT